MRPFLKASLFLLLLTALDFLFRKGLIGFFLPFALPGNTIVLVLFTAFAVGSWFVTKWFCKTDNITPYDLGISLSKRNRFDFLYGFLVGVIIWGIVSIIQSYIAGFSWELRPNISFYNIVYGLIFIFIADLGTELYTRGYPLTKFKDSFGPMIAMSIMVLFVALKSISFEVEGELLFYSIMIPALHTVFFSIIYFKTKRLGAPLGIHTGANFITISIFDLRIEQPSQAIPAGIFQANVDLEASSLTALQLPWIIAALAFSVLVYFWWTRNKQIEKV